MSHFGGTGSSGTDPMSWDVGASSWSTGLTREHFSGEVVGKKLAPDQAETQPRGGGGDHSGYYNTRWTDDELKKMKELEAARRWGKEFVDTWDNNMYDTTALLKQVKIGADFIVFVRVSATLHLCAI